MGAAAYTARRVARRGTTPVLAGMAVLAAAVALPATRAVAGEPAVIQISAVLATKDSREFDPRLDPLKHELRGLPFKGYKLLAIQACRFEAGDQCGMDIPGGGYLHVTTTESSAKHMKMRLLLNQHNRPILNADIRLNRNAGILLKSARTDYGTIILSIKCARPPAPNATAAK